MEISENANIVANDVLVNCVGHEYCSRDDETFVSEVDVLIRTSVLDIEQQDEVEGCISKSFNVVEIPKATKSLLIVDVPGKGLVFKMKLITELNVHPPFKLPLDRLRGVQYRISVKGSFTQKVHEVEEVGLFYDVGIIMEEGKKLIWYLGRVQKIIKHLDKGGHIDYVRPIQLNEEGIKILPKYYKQIEGLHYSYGGYGGHEADLVNLSPVICLIALTRDVETKDFLLAQEDKKSLNNYVKNEQKQKYNGSKRSTNTSASASPQACPTTTPFLESTSMLPTTSSHIPLVTRSGRQATRLAQF